MNRSDFLKGLPMLAAIGVLLPKRVEAVEQTEAQPGPEWVEPATGCFFIVDGLEYDCLTMELAHADHGIHYMTDGPVRTPVPTKATVRVQLLNAPHFDVDDRCAISLGARDDVVVYRGEALVTRIATHLRFDELAVWGVELLLLPTARYHG